MTLKEILPNGRDVVDENGDIRSRADFGRDDYPEPTPEQVRASKVLVAIDLWEAADEFAALAARGSKDPKVKKLGVKHCQQAAITKRTDAKFAFLAAHGFPAEAPINDDSDAHDAYDAGVRAWSQFRENIKDPGTRLVLKAILEEK